MTRVHCKRTVRRTKAIWDKRSIIWMDRFWKWRKGLQRNRDGSRLGKKEGSLSRSPLPQTSVFSKCLAYRAKGFFQAFESAVVVTASIEFSCVHLKHSSLNCKRKNSKGKIRLYYSQSWKVREVCYKEHFRVWCSWV